jgi:putative ABC transport system permease protein
VTPKIKRKEKLKNLSKNNMLFKHTISTSLKALKSHKGRSILTILGIVIGVAAIIIVMALGQGAKNLIVDQVSGLGAETVIVRPGGGLSDITSTLFSKSITSDDVEELKKPGNVPNLVSVEPFVTVVEPVEYRGSRYNPNIFGGSAEFMSDIFGISLYEGDFYDNSDIDSNARVAVLGADIKDEMFENRSAVGQDIQIKDFKFEVVGVLNENPPSAGFSFDEIVLIPHTSALTYINGGDSYNELIIRGDDPANVDKMAFDIEKTLRFSHDLKPGEDNDFNIRTQEETIDNIESIVAVLTAFLALVVAVSLVVGGVGIMNIMLVSVTERTKEIGLRKALGAKRVDILNQFLYEAVTLTSIGGVVGIIFGTLIAYVASLVLAGTVDENWRFVFPIGASFLGVGVAAAIGLIFGIYPAMQAAKKSPIEALRYE